LARDLTLFYAFAAVAVAASLAVIGQANPIYSVLLLIASFGALAGLYVLLDAPLVAVTQIIVYAGAILVLFLFVVMLLNVPREAPYDPKDRRESEGARWFGAALTALLGVELGWALSRSRGLGRDLGVPAGWSVRDIGHVLFTDYGIAFEATSILILVAMVGAVVLARRHTAGEQEREADLQPAGGREREPGAGDQAPTADH
jgi:NADH-quinone oxidoreductase subunit J